MTLDVGEFLSALADRTRLRAVILLAHEEILCVCELTEALGVSQPKMSRHLAALRESGVAEDGKIANRVFYRLNPALPEWASRVLGNLVQGLDHEAEFTGDRQRLQSMANRPDRPASFVSNHRKLGGPPTHAD